MFIVIFLIRKNPLYSDNISFSRALTKGIPTINTGCANDPVRCEDIQYINDALHNQQSSANAVWSDNRARIAESDVLEQPQQAAEHAMHEHSSADRSSTPVTVNERMQQQVHAFQQNQGIEATNPHNAIRRDFNIELFQPPTWFGEEINRKLSTGIRLTVPQESKLCREYARSMRKQTLAPTPNAIRLVVDVMYTKHKLDYLNDELATKVKLLTSSSCSLVSFVNHVSVIQKFWSEKLNNCLSRMRREDGQQINRGGRPRKEKGTSFVPISISTAGITQGNSTTNLIIPFILTYVNFTAQRNEYPLHLKRLQELWIQTPLIDGIKTLFQVTYPIRRHLITSGELPEEMTVSGFIKEHAPNLVNPHFVRINDCVINKMKSKVFSSWFSAFSGIGHCAGT